MLKDLVILTRKNLWCFQLMRTLEIYLRKIKLSTFFLQCLLWTFLTPYLSPPWEDHPLPGSGLWLSAATTHLSNLSWLPCFFFCELQTNHCSSSHTTSSQLANIGCTTAPSQGSQLSTVGHQSHCRASPPHPPSIHTVSQIHSAFSCFDTSVCIIHFLYTRMLSLIPLPRGIFSTIQDNSLSKHTIPQSGIFPGFYFLLCLVQRWGISSLWTLYHLALPK